MMMSQHSTLVVVAVVNKRQSHKHSLRLLILKHLLNLRLVLRKLNISVSLLNKRLLIYLIQKRTNLLKSSNKQISLVFREISLDNLKLVLLISTLTLQKQIFNHRHSILTSELYRIILQVDKPLILIVLDNHKESVSKHTNRIYNQLLS